MTAEINNLTATTTVNGEDITLTTADGQTITINVKQVTSVTDALLAGRKVAYANKRDGIKPAKRGKGKGTKATSGRRAAKPATAKTSSKRGTRAQAKAA